MFDLEDLQAFLPTYGVSTNSIYVINATLNNAMCEARSVYPPNVHVVTDACTSSRAEAHDAETPTHEGRLRRLNRGIYMPSSYSGYWHCSLQVSVS